MCGRFLTPHGAQKLFGWFGGCGLDTTGKLFAAKVSLQPRKGVEDTMRHATNSLNKAILTEELEQNFPNPKALDEWVPHTDHEGRRSFIRAYPPRHASTMLAFDAAVDALAQAKAKH